MTRISAAVITYLAVFTITGASARPVSAQGGGASTTGTINGRVLDTSGAVLPGVTVTAVSPSLMGVQTSVTDGGGNYRFPALPPGAYTVTFELPGFTKLERQNIQIAMGFTATVSVELAVASVQETVTVTGESPVIDTSSTRVQQNFKLEALQEIPNARDMWSLLAVTPAVTMSRIDVGGNRAGTQTTYTAYGYSGQNRVLVEGINTTEGTGGAGFYFDYGSFEEVFLGTIAQGAEMPTPGVQSQFLGKSGGNKFQGEIYQDYERNAWQGANIPSEVTARGIREHSNELEKYRDFNINVGGPIKKDKVWWYFSHRDQKTAVQQPNFVGPLAGTTFDTRLWNPSGKVTYQFSQNNKLIGYYQWGQKAQLTRLPIAANTYTSLDATWKQDSGSWIYKGEWSGTLSNRLYAEARYGVFGYYFPLLANTDTTDYYVVDSGLARTLQGGDRKGQTDRQRRQATGSLTYFKDSWGGTHNFKFGGEVLFETGWFGRTQGASGNVRVNLNNGVPVNVQVFVPTATHVGSLGDGPNGNLLSVDRLDTYDAFVNDQWTVGRTTINVGLRWDRYRAWTPEQRQLGVTVGPLTLPAQTFAEATYATFNGVAPRLGLSYDLFGTGKSVVKVNWGYYRFNPGVDLASQANPNQDNKNATYQWTDRRVCTTCIPGDGNYQVGEEGNQTAANLAGSVLVDPDLRQPYSHQATAYFEQQLAEGVGARVGFVYYATRDEFNAYQIYRPASAYTAPFSFRDIGPDGVSGSADDILRTFYGVPNSAIGGCAGVVTPTANCQFPTTQVVSNAADNGDFKTIELSLSKRQTHNYSLGGGFGYTWLHDYPNGFPNTPNGPFDQRYTSASLKATGSYVFPYEVLASVSYRFQLGSNYARTVSLSAPATCACTTSAANGTSLTTTTTNLGLYSDYRQDNISVLDVRIEKTLPAGSIAKLRLFGDFFNLTNYYAAETISRATGRAFQNPTAILGPRTMRLGFRFLW